MGLISKIMLQQIADAQIKCVHFMNYSATILI